MSDLKLLCLCPTYGRPKLLANAIACFEQQDYPHDKRQLLILDDAGQIAPQTDGGWTWDFGALIWRPAWQLFSTAERSPSLPHKYAELVRRASEAWDWDAAVIWDDDDIYLPHHLSAHAATLQNAAWSHPRKVWSLYTRSLQMEDASGRFWASLAVRRELWEQIGGPLGAMPAGHERRGDFDQMFLGACQRAAGEPGRPDAAALPSFVFRWGSTGHPHAQSLIRSPEDETWYGRFAMADVDPIERLLPNLDEETRGVYARFAPAAVLPPWQD